MKDKKISRPFIEQKIFLIQGQKVMIDRDLANLYGVSTKALLQAVRRNKKRFPTDFAYQLTEQEFNNLRSQFVTSSWGGRRYLPYAFTEQGIAMLSSVLRSERAVLVNIAIMRAFVKLREAMVAHKELASQLKVLERKVGEHDEEIQAIFKAIRQLMVPPPEKPKRQIGFHPA